LKGNQKKKIIQKQNKEMKKRICLLIALISVIFVGCSRTTSVTINIPEIDKGKVYIVYATPDQINNRQPEVLVDTSFSGGKITISLDSLQFKDKIKECTMTIVNEEKQFACNLPLPLEHHKQINVTISGVSEYMAMKSNLKVSYSGTKHAEDFSEFWQNINKTFVEMSQNKDNSKVYQQQVDLYKGYLKAYPTSGFPYSIIIGELQMIQDANNPIMKYCEQLAEQNNDNVWLKYLISAYKDKKIKAVAGKTLVFTAKDINGKTYTERDVKGKLVLVDFWASWCKPCKEAIPKLQELYTKYHSQGLEIVSISVDTNPSDWEKFLKNNKFSWLTLLGNGQEITQRYDFQYIPYVLLVDNQGKVLKSNVQVEELEKFIGDYLSK
jgi:thiol-disulfide isomerase/thioredoxin